MKALSIQQPFADFIQNLHKKYEIRSWQTSYRGLLLVCSSQTVARCFRVDKSKIDPENQGRIYTFDPADLDLNGFLHYGKALFLCNLTHIEPFEPHHAPDAFIAWQPGLFAWHFEDIQPVEPFEVKGKLNFYDVSNEKIILIH